MPGKARVRELAEEFGVPTHDVLAKLKELGEFVKSASTTVEAPVARRLRECYPQRPRPLPTPQDKRPPVAPHAVTPPQPPVRERLREIAVREAARDPFRAAAALSNHRPRREWYRGEEPGGLTKYLLDHYVVPQRDPEERPPGRPYWTDEVRRARRLSDDWAPALLDGLEWDDILAWVSENWSYLPAVGELHRAGVRPHELGWSYEDRGSYTLGERLRRGLWTTEMVVTEVSRRRGLT